jgi:hypothetical protein
LENFPGAFLKNEAEDEQDLIFILASEKSGPWSVCIYPEEGSEQAYPVKLRVHFY